MSTRICSQRPAAGGVRDAGPGRAEQDDPDGRAARRRSRCRSGRSRPSSAGAWARRPRCPSAGGNTAARSARRIGALRIGSSGARIRPTVPLAKRTRSASTSKRRLSASSPPIDEIANPNPIWIGGNDPRRTTSSAKPWAPPGMRVSRIPIAVIPMTPTLTSKIPEYRPLSGSKPMKPPPRIGPASIANPIPVGARNRKLQVDRAEVAVLEREIRPGTDARDRSLERPEGDAPGRPRVEPEARRRERAAAGPGGRAGPGRLRPRAGSSGPGRPRPRT